MKPYSYDLRIRIFNYSLTHTIRETARIFQVSPNTVYLLTQLFIETGSLNPRDNLHERPHLITPEGELYLYSARSRYRFPIILKYCKNTPN